MIHCIINGTITNAGFCGVPLFVCFYIEYFYVAQIGLELLNSNYPPDSTSQVAETTSMGLHAQL
jgi:hypothetical protein